MMVDDPLSLDHLHDIVEPAPVSWWPPAGFWISLMLLAAFWGVYLAVAMIRQWRRNAYRRAALQELTTISEAVQVSTLLKRVALVAYPREDVAALTGDQWIEFLDDRCHAVNFEKEPESFLALASYDSHAAAEADKHLPSLIHSARTWITRHQVEQD